MDRLNRYNMILVQRMWTLRAFNSIAYVSTIRV